MLERLRMRTPTNKPGHAFVLGTGIAGLSVAEVLSRNGWTITVLDSAPTIGGDASRCTQNWFHTGWLYAALPYTGAMAGCASSLRLLHEVYDPVLPDDVVNVCAGDHGVEYPLSARGWFTPDRIHYLFAIATRDLNAAQKLTWPTYLRTVPLRRLRRFGYATRAATELAPNLVELLNRWEGHSAGHAGYWVIPSTDARINTKRVLSTLVRMLGSRAAVVPSARYELGVDGDRTIVRIGKEVHRPDLCIIAAGKSTADLLRSIGAGDTAAGFKSICSPIVVLGRALDLPSFIRFTPNLPETVNHVRYEVDGRDVSTIGSYDYHPPEERPDIRPFIEKVCRRIGVSTSEVVGSYYGTKTEVTGSFERRYNHAIAAVNANTYYAIAGKFSQFPLLVKEFAVKLGLRLDLVDETRGTLALDVAPTAPERLVNDFRKNESRTHAA